MTDQVGAGRVSTGQVSAGQVSAGVLRQWRREAIASQAAKEAAHPPAPVAVDWLLQQLAQVDKLALRLATDDEVLPLACSFDWLDQVWQRHHQDGVPLQYLVGHAPWRNFELQVGPGVLIPRPETELLIDLVQNQVGSGSPERQTAWSRGAWADLGTGSGAIALGLAELFPAAQIHAVDCSTEALAIARTNVERYRHVLGARLQLHLGDWFTPLEPWRGQFQGILSNPPYIPSSLLPTLQIEVRDHEPWLALDGGEDGLDSLRTLIQVGADFLAPGGFWAVELMAGQAPVVEALLQAHGGYGPTGRASDLAGIERFVWGYRRISIA